MFKSFISNETVFFLHFKSSVSCYFGFFSLFLCLSLVTAQIDPKQFKNVSNHLLPTYQYLSPTLGCVLLNGTLHNLRFYECSNDEILKTGIIPDGVLPDEAIQAKENCSDPTVRLVYHLFSPPATLNITGISESFFFLMESIKPTLVAGLLNYTIKIRDFMESKNKIKDELVDSEDFFLAWEKAFKIDFRSILPSQSKNFHVVLELIKLSIENECKKEKYPKYFTEQIILGYFCMKFHYKSDILELLEGLDERVKNPSVKQASDDIWTNDAILSLIENPHDLDLDGFYFLSSYSFDRIPYEIDRVSKNGTTCSCKRSGTGYDDVIFNKEWPPFQDCVENAILHFLNILLLLFSKNTNTISTDILQKISGASNLVLFLEYQNKVGWEAETPEYRTEWNKVVGDLNYNIKANDKTNNNILIKYEREHCSLATGFVNFVKVLFRITGNDLRPPTSDDVMSSWVKTSLQGLISKITNLNEENIFIGIEHETYCKYTNEVHGDLMVKIFNLTFVVSSNKMHMFTVIKEDKDRITITLPPVDCLNWLSAKPPTVQSLWVLGQDRFKPPEPKIVLHNVYEIYGGIGLFSTRYTNALFTSKNEQEMEFSKSIFCRTRFSNYELPPSLASFKLCLDSRIYLVNSDKNLEISFLANETNLHLEVPNLTSVKISGTNISASFKCNHLSQLSISGMKNISVNLKNLTKLELQSTSTERTKIMLCRTKSSSYAIMDIVNFKIQEPFDFGKLTSLSLEGFDISLIGSTKPSKQDRKNNRNVLPTKTENQIRNGIKGFDMQMIGEIDETVKIPMSLNYQQENALDLSKFSGLEDLKIRDCSGIPEILIPENLIFLDLNNSNVQMVKIDKCDNLSTINLVAIKELKSLILTNLTQLKHLNLRDSNIKIIELNELPGLSYLDFEGSNAQKIEINRCENLRTIELANTGKLGPFKLANLPQLEYLSLNNSNVRTVEIDACGNLLAIDLAATKELESFKLSNLSQLKLLSLNNSNLQTVEIDACLKLYSIDLASTIGLKSVKLTNLPGLEYLSLRNSNIQTVEINLCYRLYSINLVNTGELKLFKLTNLCQLEYLNLSSSNVQIVEICACGDLHSIELVSTDQLGLVELIGLPQLSNLNLQNSSVKIVVIENCEKLNDLNFYDSQNLEKVVIKDCVELVSIGLPKNQIPIILVNLPKLKTINSELQNDVIVKYDDGSSNRITYTLPEIAL